MGSQLILWPYRVGAVYRRLRGLGRLRPGGLGRNVGVSACGGSSPIAGVTFTEAVARENGLRPCSRC